MRVNLPLIGRTVSKTQGCYNCFHAEADPVKVLERWKTVDRPARDLQIAEAKQAAASAGNFDPGAVARFAKTGRNDQCPCGSGAKYKRCHLDKDKASESVMKRIEGIENATRIADNIEAAIGQGLYMICKNRGKPDKFDTYVNHRFLCDQWSAAQGASIAREGAAPDKLPEELKDIHGDGN